METVLTCEICNQPIRQPFADKLNTICPYCWEFKPLLVIAHLEKKNNPETMRKHYDDAVNKTPHGVACAKISKENGCHCCSCYPWEPIYCGPVEVIAGTSPGYL